MIRVVFQTGLLEFEVGKCAKVGFYTRDRDISAYDHFLIAAAGPCTICSLAKLRDLSVQWVNIVKARFSSCVTANVEAMTAYRSE